MYTVSTSVLGTLSVHIHDIVPAPRVDNLILDMTHERERRIREEKLKAIVMSSCIYPGTLCAHQYVSSNFKVRLLPPPTHTHKLYFVVSFC